jgi:serine protease Do
MTPPLFSSLLTGLLALFFFWISAIAGMAQAASLPDFTKLVAQEGRAVVNISAASAEHRAPEFPGIDEDDPMFDFFRRLIPRHPSMPNPSSEDRSLGSGFIIHEEGYILTNAHVVESGEDILVKLSDKREFPATVVGTDKRTDVALIRIKAANLPVVRLGNPHDLEVGEWVLAIGAPFGFENSVTAGIVSAKGRSLPQENFVPFIQTDVAINPGNSGGPLFNLSGEVVGMNSQIYSRTGGFMGLSFAIPIDMVMDVQAQLREHGRVRRGRIGVVIQDVTPELAHSFGLPQGRGALVSAVEPGSPADKAGIQQGDILLSFDGVLVENSGDLPRIVGGTSPKKTAEIALFRAGKPHEIAIVVGEIKEETLKRPALRTSAAGLPNQLGLVLREPSAAERREIGPAGGVVIEVARGPALRAQLQTGDVIRAVVIGSEPVRVRTVSELESHIATQEPGGIVSLLVSRGEHTSFVSLKVEGP